MQPFPKLLPSLFPSNVRYVVPLFQRPYVWDEERQWEPLWDDIRFGAELELDISRQGRARTEPPHFLGAIVVQSHGPVGDHLAYYDVIDGQQRLTTLQIVLAVVRDICSVVLAGSQENAWLRALTVNLEAMVNTEVESFKLWPTARDVDQFRFVITAGSKAAVESKHPAVFKWRRLQSRPRMVEAYLFFHDAVTDWLQEDGADGAVDRLKALRRCLGNHLQVVSIELQQDEDPQAIFETMNARGVPLLASDLLRNNIFQRAGRDAESLYEKFWKRFEMPDRVDVPDGARLWDIEQRQGRLLRARLDLFVQHYLGMKLNAGKRREDPVVEVLTNRLFLDYRTWVSRSPAPFASIEEELREFARYADLFLMLLKPAGHRAVERISAAMEMADTSTAYPLVLAVLGDDGLDTEAREGILADIESFLVRRVICGRTTKNYNRLFLQLVRDFFGSSPRTRDDFAALLSAGTGESVDWPDDGAFFDSWTTVDAYNVLKAWRVQPILKRLDEAMRPMNADVEAVIGNLTVEHVMPVTWRPNWPLPAASDDADPSLFAAEASIRREEVIHDFGNLTLLTQPLNSSVSNGPAKEKLPAIALHTMLPMNAYFRDRTSWTEDDIRSRGKELFEFAKRIWQGPPDRKA